MDTTLITQIPDDFYKKYFLELSAHNETLNKIVNMKEEFFKKYEAPATRWCWPHITFSNFRRLKWWKKKF